MPDDELTSKKTGTQAIERAISILRLFTEGDRAWSLTEVARAAGLTTGTTHRILATLVRERLLANDPASERYRIGPDSLFLFAAAARRFGIAATRSELEVVVSRTHETAALGVLDGCDTIVVLQVESDLPLRFSRPIGTRVPMHVSAMGKAILAFSGRDSSATLDALGELHRFTDHTVTDKPRLLGELDVARARGWTINDNERYEGVRAVAVPILQGDDPVRASIGIQGPAERLPDSRVVEIVEHLQTSAQRIAQHLSLTTL
ncbi:MAG: Transcriptional regulator, IclR family [Ilumatobacteraceae bacterium]|nr:Transcriptional regulator, IclR family [Ilumatobacteraceae bacterium]